MNVLSVGKGENLPLLFALTISAASSVRHDGCRSRLEVCVVVLLRRCCCCSDDHKWYVEAVITLEAQLYCIVYLVSGIKTVFERVETHSGVTLTLSLSQCCIDILAATGGFSFSVVEPRSCRMSAVTIF